MKLNGMNMDYQIRLRLLVTIGCIAHTVEQGYDLKMNRKVTELVEAFADALTNEDIIRSEEYAKGYVDGVKETLENTKGKWEFIGDNMYMCSNCKTPYTMQQFAVLRHYKDDPYQLKCCPNCGAHMEEI